MYPIVCVISGVAYSFISEIIGKSEGLTIAIIVYLLLSIPCSVKAGTGFYFWASVIVSQIAIIIYINNENKKLQEFIGFYKTTSNTYGFNLKEILKDAYKAYVRIQIAWMNDEIDSVSDIISDEMLNQYNAQLSTLRIKHEQNVMNSFKDKGGIVYDIKESSDKYKTYYNIGVILKVKCKDYLINKDTKKILRGKKYKNNYYVYNLRFIKAIDNVDNCPNCGAVLEKGGGVICSSCGSKVIVNNGEMELTHKNMIYQR